MTQPRGGLRPPVPTPAMLLERERGLLRGAIERAREQLRETQWPRDRVKLTAKIERLTETLNGL